MKNIFYNILIVLTIVMTHVSQVKAVPASPRQYTAVQPDGSTLGVYLHGDEHFHFATTIDNFPIAEVEGEWRYVEAFNDAGMKVSDVAASSPEHRSAAEREFLSSLSHNGPDGLVAEKYVRKSAHRQLPGRMGRTFPCQGEQKALVILVEYKDVAFTTPDARNYFSDMLNKQGFAENGATGSARDYFLASSSGVFSPEFDVYGPVKLPHTRAYYGANDAYGNDRRPGEMVIDACNLLDGEIDFTQYDRDGNGVIDNIFIFYAGRGEATGGGANTIWPHSFTLADKGLKYDGLLLDTYGCTNEQVLGGADGKTLQTDAIGTFCHEFSHVLGLPDLYATTYTTAITPGQWTIMDKGSYNNDSRTPPSYSSFERAALGWLEPPFFQHGESDVELRPLAESGQSFLLPGFKAGEYFLFECRVKEGWDAYIPGAGMLVWHIEFDQKVWDSNIVNNDPSCQHVELVKAHGDYNLSPCADDAFPFGESSDLGFSTSPSALKDREGRDLGLELTGITRNEDGSVKFHANLSREISPDEGVDEIGFGDGFAVKEYYNLQGQRVLQPERGQLVIVRQGGKCRKEIFD